MQVSSVGEVGKGNLWVGKCMEEVEVDEGGGEGGGEEERCR